MAEGGLSGPGLDVPGRYGLIGHPVAQSRSPHIHRAFARQTGRALTYELIDALPERFGEAVAGFFDAGGRGLNVTVPHKGAAFALADAVSAEARIAGAVNTLSAVEDGLAGDNTDGVGLVTDLVDNLRVRVAGARVLMIGAGGAARGVLAPLLACRPARVVIANRTPERARELVRRVAGLGNVGGGGLDEPAGQRFDLVIQATSAGLDGAVAAVPASVCEGAVCYDMVYGPRQTAFMRWAAARGALAVHSGWGMLVEQAAESFRIWHGVRPDTRAVREEETT